MVRERERRGLEDWKVQTGHWEVTFIQAVAGDVSETSRRPSLEDVHSVINAEGATDQVRVNAVELGQPCREPSLSVVLPEVEWEWWPVPQHVPHVFGKI